MAKGILSERTLSMSEGEFRAFVNSKDRSPDTKDRYWRAWREYQRENYALRAKGPGDGPRRPAIREEKDYLVPTPAGNRYLLVVKVYTSQHFEAFYCSIEYYTWRIGRNDAQYIYSKVARKYRQKQSDITINRIDLVQTIDQLATLESGRRVQHINDIRTIWER